jgi:hypothetical protein
MNTNCRSERSQPFRAIGMAAMILFATMAGCVSGHRTDRVSHQAAVSSEHSILKTLATRDRNAVHVALWTLEHNDLSVPEHIAFNLPYAEAQPKIQAILEYLRTLPETKLTALDQSLSNHWRLYSPFWINNDWP